MLLNAPLRCRLKSSTKPTGVSSDADVEYGVIIAEVGKAYAHQKALWESTAAGRRVEVG